MGSREPGCLAIRADAGPQIGTGHVMRCVALGQAWQATGGNVEFICAELPEPLHARLRDEGFELSLIDARPGQMEDVEQTASVACRADAKWIVIDGYQFGRDFHCALQNHYRVLVVDDDGHAAWTCANVVLNHNASASELLYPGCPPATQMVLGSCFALLRREFREAQPNHQPVAPVANRLLVTCGGADPANVTRLAIDALTRTGRSDLEAVVLVGAANPRFHELTALAQNATCAIRVERNVCKMTQLMQWADMAFSAAGSVAWELAYIGVPNLAVVVAENQRRVAEAIDAAGAAVNLGWHHRLEVERLADIVSQLANDPGRRQRMRQSGQSLIDGRGAQRVVQVLQQPAVSLRPVRQSDCRLLWLWRNDPAVRVSSFNSNPVEYELHCRWFNARLNDPATRILVAESESGTPVGQVRLDLKNNEAEISISVDQKFRGGGFGQAMIGSATALALRELDLRAVHGFIRPENAVSIRSFERAGYRRIGETQIRGATALHFIQTRTAEPR